MNLRIRAFLYVLLRDHLTLGQCEQLMRDADKAHELGASFSNTHLRDYLDELFARLNK